MDITNKTPRRGRPPKQSNDKIDTKTALIRSGTETLTERGYITSDIETILKKVNIPKGSFYYYFANKEAFGQEVMENYAHYFAAKLDKHLLNTLLSPLQRIHAFYLDAKAGMEKYHFERGCLIGNLSQEVSTLPQRYRHLLNDILKTWQDRIASCLHEAQRRGEISSTADCETLATFFWIGWEGAVMRAKLDKNAKPLTIFITQFLEGLPR